MWSKFLESVLQHVLIAGVLGALGLVLYALARRGRYPTLQPPEGEPLSPRERRVWRLVGTFSCLSGLAGAFALYATPPLELPGSLALYGPYAAMRVLGPILFGLSFALVAIPTWIRWLVDPDRLPHLLWREANQAPFLRLGDRVLDPRPIGRWVGLLGATLALVVHFAVRQAHFALTEDGVRWCDWPWDGFRERPWGEVVGVQLVRYVKPLVGGEIDRPHLRLRFRDGELVTFGKSADGYLRDRIDQFAQIAVERTGQELERVDR